MFRLGISNMSIFPFFADFFAVLIRNIIMYISKFKC
jgi:hypothetical protein